MGMPIDDPFTSRAMQQVTNEIRKLNLEMARQNLKSKKITEPAKSAKSLAQNG